MSLVTVQMIQLFLCIMLGYLLAKCKKMSKDFTNELSKFVMNVCMPAMIIGSIYNINYEKMLPFQDILIACSIVLILLPLVAFMLVKLLRVKKQPGLHMFMMMYPNVGFIGFPLIQAILGSEAVLSTAMINMGFNLSLYTLGILVINYGTNNQVIPRLKEAISPGVIASLVVILMYFTRVSIPEIFASSIISIGNMTTPLAMLIIGSTLANCAFKNLFKDVKDYAFIFFLNIALPIMFYPVIVHCIHDSMIRGITIIILAMPIANSAVIFASIYKQDEMFAAKMLLLSTMFAAISIPWIVQMFLG